MADFYVSSTGNDSNVGDYDNPWLTTAAVTAAVAASTIVVGDTVHFEGGSTFVVGSAGDVITLNGILGGAAAGITLTSYGNGRALIKTFSNNLSLISLTNSNYVTVKDIDLEGVTLASGSGYAIHITGGSNCKFKNVYCKGHTKIVQQDNGTAHRYERVYGSQQWDGGFSWTGTATATFDDIEISYCGYSTDLATQNGTWGPAIELTGTANVDGQSCDLINCVQQIETAAGTELNINRVYYKVTQDDQDIGTTNNGTCRLVNGVFVYDARISEATNTNYDLIQNNSSLQLVNCSLASLVEGTADLGGGGEYPVLLRNTATGTVSVTQCTTSSILSYLIENETGGNYSGSYNNHYSALDGSGTSMRNGGGAVTVATWNAALETGSLNQDPGYINIIYDGPSQTFTRVTNDADLLLIDKSSPLWIQGLATSTIKSTLFNNFGWPYTDYYGNKRNDTLTRWTIGAHEPAVDTYQDIVDNTANPAWLPISPPGLPTYAALLQISKYKGFSFVIDSDLYTANFFDPATGADKVGIWALGSRMAESWPASIYDTAQGIYDAPQTPDDTSFNTSSNWQMGPGPEVDFDSRRIIAYIQSDTKMLHVVSENPEVVLDRSVRLAVDTSTDSLNLKMEFTYKGRLPGGIYGSYQYDLAVYVDDVRKLVVTGLDIPATWMEGIGYNYGAADYVGLYSVTASTVDYGWDSFSGSITSNLGSLTPRVAGGEAREKDIMALRGQATNLLINGGFHRYPRDKAVVVREGVVRRVDPNYTPVIVNDKVGVHVGFIIDNANMTNAARTSPVGSSYNPPDVRFRAIWHYFITEFLNSAIPDDTIIVTVVEHWGFGSSNILIPPTLLNTANAPALESAVVNGWTVKGGGAWTTGWHLMANLMKNVPVQVNGVNQDGYNKIVFNVIADDPANGASAASIDAARVDLHSIPGLKEVSLLSVWQYQDVVYNQGSWPSFFFPLGTAVNSPTTGNAWEAASAAPAVDGAICIAVDGDSSSKATVHPTLSTGEIGALANETVGQTLFTQVQKWWDDWDNQVLLSQQEPPYVYADAFQAISARNPGYSLNVPSSRPAENEIGGWYVWGSTSVLEIMPPEDRPSEDGGNVIRVVMGEQGTVTLAQPLSDLQALAGQWLTVAFSAAAGQEQVKIELVCVVNGEDQVLGTFYSRSFGLRSRVTEATQLPNQLDSLELQLRLVGNADTSVFLGGIQASQGRYKPQLPYSECPVDSIIPPGTVIMHLGDSCPPGYRQLPESVDRIPYGFLGDPSFYKRDFPYVAPDPNAPPATPAPVYSSTLDLVMVIDGSNNLVNHRTTIAAWVQDLLTVKMPQDGTVRAAIVFSSRYQPGYILLPLTYITPSNITNYFLPAVQSITDLSSALRWGSNDRMWTAIATARGILLGGNAEKRAVVYNLQPQAPQPSVRAEFDLLAAIPRYVETSAVVIGASFTQSTNLITTESYVYPQPKTTKPGIVFAATGGAPGYAILNQYQNQPYQAGIYASDVMFDSLSAHLPVKAPLIFQVKTVEGVEADNLGGYLEHDHASGIDFGSSIDESDGFEPASDGESLTAAALPTQETAQINPYPYGILPNLTRPEDEPTRVIGPQHRHSVNTKMEAQPPGFRVRFCEKI